MKKTTLLKAGIIVLSASMLFASCKPGARRAIGEDILPGLKDASRAHKVQTINQIVSNSSSSTTQTVTCNNCNGKGEVYKFYPDGSWQVDAYGYPVLYTCPQCGGKGYLVI